MRNLNVNMKWLKPPVFLACLLPAIALALQGFSGQINSGPWLAHLGLQPDLGANPIQRLTFATGSCALIFLTITLAITPLRKITKQAWLIKFRRMFGLFAFFYVCVHFAIYWVDLYFSAQLAGGSISPAAVLHDIAKRPFITAGFTAFVLMIPLALTSTAGWIRRLGGKRWQLLHRLIYLSAIAAVVHYWWQVKSDIRQPLLYAVIIGLLLSYRVIAALLARRKKAAGQGFAGARQRQPESGI